MAQIDLGKLKFTWKGVYTSATAYEVDDVVFYNGSSYTVTTAVLATNTTDPGLNSSFSLMSRGINYRGVYSSSATYLQNDVVTYNNASWISIQANSFTNQAPDVSPTYWQTLTPAPSSNVLTTPGDLVYVAKDGVTSRLPIGTKGTTLTTVEAPNQTFARGFTYSVGTGSPATAIATDLDSALVVGSNAANGSITVTRGRSYSITFPANTKTYSIKSTSIGGYSTSGTGGRLASGVVPAFIANGGTLLFSPDASTPNTVLVRDELSGLDVLTITVVNMPLVPSWSGASTQKAGFAAFSRNYNTNTSALLPNSHVGGTYYGRGLQNTVSFDGYRKGSYLAANGKVYSWGNVYHNATQGYHYSNYGYGQLHNTVTAVPLQTQLRMPRWFNAAIAGDTNEAKWLTDLSGNSLGYTMNAVPKIIKYIGTSNCAFFLTENGIAFGSGYNGYAVQGNGNNATAQYQAAMPIQFYNSSATALTGVNRPKITQIVNSGCGDVVAEINTTLALDTNGVVYRWGYNAYGQLADTTTTNNFFARAIAQSFFNSEKVISIYIGGGNNYGSCYAITETGKLYCWGYNGFGQLGLGDTVNKTQPYEATAITGSGIQNKKVIHVVAAGSDSTFTKTLVLTTEGKVYGAGSAESFGQFLGVYSSASVNQTSFTEITNASTTFNSGNQKVVSLWTTGGRYPSWYAITDGGTLNQPKVYSWGNNATQQLGRNASQTALGSASIQGDWFPAEILFEDFGDQEVNSTPTSGSRPNEIRGLGQYNASWTGKFKFGTPVAVLGCGNSTNQNQPAVLLDNLGQVFIAGYWPTYPPTLYSEGDDPDNFELSEDQPRFFTMLYTAPERIVDWMFLSYPSDIQAYMCAGASGTVYTAGDPTWNCTAQLNLLASRGFHPLIQSLT